MLRIWKKINGIQVGPDVAHIVGEIKFIGPISRSHRWKIKLQFWTLETIILYKLIKVTGHVNGMRDNTMSNKPLKKSNQN